MAGVPGRKPNPLEDPIFQQQPLDTGAPLDPALAGSAQFPPTADVESYGAPVAADVPDAPIVEAPPAPVALPPAAAAPGGSAAAKTVTTDQRIVQSPAEVEAAKQELAANARGVDAARALADADAKQGFAGAQADQMQAARTAEIASQEQRQRDLAAQKYELEQQIAKDETTRAEQQVKADVEATGRSPFTGNLGASIFAALVTGASTYNAFQMGKDPSEMPAVKAIDQYVERDRQVRLAKLATSKEFLAEKRKGPEAARAAWQDANDRITIQNAARLKTAIAQAESLKANGKVDRSRFDAIAQAAVAAKEVEAAQAANRLGQRQSFVRSTETTRLPAAGPDAKNLVRWQGKDYNVGDEVSARQMRDKASATDGLVQQLDELATSIEKYKTMPLSMGKERGEVEANIARLTGEIKSQQSLGALDKGVQTLVGSMVSDPTSIKNWIFKGGREGSLSTIRAAKAQAMRSVENGLAANPSTGFQRAAAGGGEDPDAGLSVADLKRVLATSKDPALLAKARQMLAGKK